MIRRIPRLEGLARGVAALRPDGRTRDELRPEAHVRWMRERLFPCVDHGPLAVSWRLGVAVSERVPLRTDDGGLSLDAWLQGPDAELCAELRAELSPGSGARAVVLRECGLEVGRLHALRFLHGALGPHAIRVFPTGAVGGPGHGRRIAFAALGAGGLAPWARGRALTRASELEGFVAGLAPWLGPGDADCLRAAYAEGRRHPQ